MPQFMSGPFEIDYNVNSNATISFDVHHTSELASRYRRQESYRRHDSLSIANPSITIPISIADNALSGSITFGLDTANTQFVISGSAGVDITVYAHN